MNLIGFNPNYPALHMSEALASLVTGNHDWNADQVGSIIDQAMVLIKERRKSFTRNELSELRFLLGFVSRP